MDAGTLGVVELGGGVDAVQHGQGPPHCAGSSTDSSTTEHQATSSVKSSLQNCGSGWVRINMRIRIQEGKIGGKKRKNARKMELIVILF